MNPLDRQIAEIKGWEYVPAGTEIFIHGKGATAAEGWIEKIGPMKSFHAAFNCNWSGSDSKALELVDELTAVKPGEDPEWGFMCGFFGKEWRATFYRAVRVPWAEGLTIHPEHQFEGSGPNTPEGRRQAIGKAFVAAVTWMRGRKA